MQSPNKIFNFNSYKYVFSLDAKYLDQGTEPLEMREAARLAFGVIPNFNKFITRSSVEFDDYPVVERMTSREWDLLTLKLFGMLNEVE